MKKLITKETKTGKLSPVLVDEFSEYVSQALSETKMSRNDIIRFRFSIETAMCEWLDALGEGAECSFEINKRFGRLSIVVSCKGEKYDPISSTDEEFGILENSSLLQSLGLSLGYSYENGYNKIKFMPNPGSFQKLVPILISFALGIGLALLFKYMEPDVAASFNTNVVDPVFSTLMSLLRAVASPLIFLAVLSGIYGIGDIAVLGTIGKKLLGRFIGMTFLALIISLVVILLMNPSELGSYTVQNNALNEILALVLQFVPPDIVSPFLNGNMLQIISISVACGLVMLILGDRVSELCKIVDQVYSVVQILMEAIAKLVPVFIFVSMFSLFLSNDTVESGAILQPIFAITITFLIMALVVYPIIIRVKYKIGFVFLLRKLIPTFIVALSTASSAAAFSINVDTCEKRLGISERITRFGVPLGQVVYMPFAAVEYLAISMFLARSWDVEMSIVWIIMAVVVCGILAIATPPIPGGAMSIFTVLFLQLNIPEAVLPVALGIDLIIDYLVTAGDIMCLQEELIICADKTDLLNKDTLRKNN